jgi:hypothetical protein
MKKSFFVAAIFIVLASTVLPAHADIYMKHKQHTGKVIVNGKSQPPQDVVLESWISTEAMRSNNDKNGFIIYSKDGQFLVLDHARKVYSEISVPADEMARIMGENKNPQAMAQVKKMMSKLLDVKVSVQKTGESKKINGYNCTKYNQTMQMAMGSVNNVIWATTDLKYDNNLIADFSAATMARQPGMQNMMKQMVEEMKKIKGVHILTETTQDFRGKKIKSTIELLEIKNVKSPALIFQVLKDYKKEILGKR